MMKKCTFYHELMEKAHKKTAAKTCRCYAPFKRIPVGVIFLTFLR
ncbi:MAG: hypothetical protein K0Q79_491 [Flavipsychrobacter sp.]|jgi:hypothetical protein|nr:hypothetical protein [Flavipsychrobacter sp.]